MVYGSAVPATGHAESPGLFLIDGTPADSFPSPGRLAMILAASAALGVSAALALAVPSILLYRMLSHAV